MPAEPESDAAQRDRAATPRWRAAAADAGTRLDKFLAAAGRLGSRSKVASALERGKVFLNGTEARLADASHRLVAGDEVALWEDRPGSAKRRGPFSAGDLRVLHEDDSLIVVDKPAGLLAVPLDARSAAPSAYDLVEQHLRSQGKRKPFVVHRIDLDTSGLVVFAKSAEAQQVLKAQFRRREPERRYWAVVHGHPSPAAGTWRDRLVWDDKALLQKPARPGDREAVEAVCHYRVVERYAGASLVEVTLETGKQNQIRIQASLHGHPLVGERRYVAGIDEEARISFTRQALHARRLSFVHPQEGRPMTFEAPLPADLETLLGRLRRAARR